MCGINSIPPASPLQTRSTSAIPHLAVNLSATVTTLSLPPIFCTVHPLLSACHGKRALSNRREATLTVYRVTSSLALGAPPAAMTRTKRTRSVHALICPYQANRHLHHVAPSPGPHTDAVHLVEGQAQIRATAATHDPHRQEEEEGCWSQRRCKASDCLPDCAMQAKVPADAAHPRPSPA
jgi:hypothetical protein